MTHEELKEKFASTADWRLEIQEHYRNDPRNSKAAEKLQQLATTAADVPQHLLDAYDAAFLRVSEMSSVIETEKAPLRSIGFHFEPETAAEFVTRFLELAARDVAVDGSYRPRPV